MFLNEINTSEEVASFKEIICGHGDPLPKTSSLSVNHDRARKLSVE